MTNEKNEKQPVMKILRNMEIGDVASFPVERIGYVKMAACNFGLQSNRKFKTAIKRTSRLVELTRVL